MVNESESFCVKGSLCALIRNHNRCFQRQKTSSQLEILHLSFCYAWWPRWLSGYGHELVAGLSRARVLLPLQTRRVDEGIPPADVVDRKRGSSSGVLLVTRPRLKITRNVRQLKCVVAVDDYRSSSFKIQVLRVVDKHIGDRLDVKRKATYLCR
ncbi:hypothetical protein TNCV_3897031 [Trichonephila clavipes]|nr:hypothetical protein TNCV_3897031 [Trichonephila clavipes]